MSSASRLGLLTAVVALSLPGTALGSSGSITNVAPIAGGQVTATYTTNFDVCDSDGYCGWYPHAWEVPASKPCSEDKSNLTYVGGPEDDIYTKSGSETATDTFYPHHNPTRICLYARHSSREYFIAEYVYTAASAPTTPAGPEAKPMGIKEARDLLPSVLRKRYGARFRGRSGPLQRSCSRLTTEKVRCRVGWNYTRYRYSGTVTLRNDPDDESRYLASASIRRRVRR